jgi:hypothetical protein
MLDAKLRLGILDQRFISRKDQLHVCPRSLEHWVHSHDCMPDLGCGLVTTTVFKTGHRRLQAYRG